VTPALLGPDAVAIVLLAPAASVLAAIRRQRGARATIVPLLGAIAALVAASLIVTFATRSSPSSPIGTIITAHVTLAAAGLAFAAIGALCARGFEEVLDAAAASGAIALALTFALLLAGDLAAQLPTAVVDTGLVASPLVAIASAADLDLLRTDAWYRASPIAHRSFSYPLWYHAAGSYALVSFICAVGFIWKTERPL
jgi:hypothetical protein